MKTLLIISDIFGATPALAQLARELGDSLRETLPSLSTDILAPYDKDTWFEDEAQAYAYFTRHLGIKAYAERIGRHLDKTPNPTILLAFSAGASAIWHLAGTAPCPRVIGAVGFYGSQIRHDTCLSPRIDIHLIYPDSEPHFDVDNLMAILSDTPGTSCEKAEGRHGFMNRLSDHFDEHLYRTFIRERLPERLMSMIT